MELKVFWRAVRRRWYVTVVVVALTLAAAAYVVVDVGPDYEAEGSTLVFPPASSTRTQGELKTVGNPYLELAGVSQARDVVIRTLQSRNVQDDWSSRFPGMSFTATPDFTNSAPIILFTVEGGTSDGTAAALDDLVARVPVILRNLQDGLGLNEQDYVTSRTLTKDARPEVVRKTQVRAGLLATAVAGGLGLMLLALVDSLMTARSRRRARRAAERAAAQVAAEQEAAEREAAEREAAEAPVDVPPAVDRAGDRTAPPLYTYRVPVDAELAISPARSRWARDTGVHEARRLGGVGTALDVRARTTGRTR